VTSTTNVQSWKVGAATITAIVEAETPGVPTEFFFPESTAAGVAEQTWLVPTFASADGALIFRVQAFVVEVGARVIVVDPCVGNGKRRMLPFWNEQQYTFLADFAAAGFDVDAVDVVLHTHLHADHVGWDTHLLDGVWTPTFTNARHLYTQRELDHWMATEQRTNEDVYADSVEPIFAAGLADIVAEDADLGDGLRLSPTTGHTPGHVSLWIDSEDERGVISGDLMHHPVQCARPEWAEIGDWDGDIARTTRRAFLDEVCRDQRLVLGTHFPTAPAGRVVVAGDAWRFEPA
jgi:glyoxylase-like metal-dependent hydrolase (beta-lactamase superfamily II)